MPLAGFEEWLQLNAVKVTSSNRMVSIKYKRPKDAVYRTGDGKLSIHFESAEEFVGNVFGTAVTLKEMASVSLRFSKALVLEDLIAQYQLLEDLLLILTGSDRALEWPWIVARKFEQYRSVDFRGELTRDFH